MSASVADALTSDNDGMGYLPAQAGFRLDIVITASLLGILLDGASYIQVNGRLRRTGLKIPEKISGEFPTLFPAAIRFMFQGRRRRLKAITSIHREGGKIMEFSVHEQNQGKKMTGVVFAVLFHIALVWALMNGLGTHLTFDPPKPPIDVTVLPDSKPVEPPPPEHLFDIKDVKVDFVPPVVIPVNVQDNDNTIKDKTAVDPEHKDIRIVRHDDAVPDVRVPPVMDASACERPEYPSHELTNGVEGTTILQLFIGTNGRVMDSKLARSSGSSALDKAALVGLTRCPFKAAMVNGKPEAAWTKVQYVWRIE